MSLKLLQYNFNHAAATYLANAPLQKNCALPLLAYLKDYQSSGLVLDLGSGPGTFSHQATPAPKTIIRYDISLSMLKIKAEGMAVNGDAAALPFASNSIGTVMSNLMVQWPLDKAPILTEIQRILRPGGYFMFTTLIAPSLWQLQLAWQQIDHEAHTLEFLTTMEYHALCQATGLQLIHSDSWSYDMHFTDIQALLRHFKVTGTTLTKTPQRSGLGGKKSLLALDRAYPLDRKSRLPLTYQPLLIIVRKEAHHD